MDKTVWAISQYLHKDVATESFIIKQLSLYISVISSTLN